MGRNWAAGHGFFYEAFLGLATAVQLGEGQNTRSSRPGHSLRPAVDIEFAIDVTGMDLDRVQREIKPLSNLSIGEP